MNTSCREMIVLLLQESLRSELDLSSFCDEFCFHYLKLEEGNTKESCKDLFHHVSNYMMSEHTDAISIEEIQVAANIFDAMKKTYNQLIIPKLMN